MNWILIVQNDFVFFFPSSSCSSSRSLIQACDWNWRIKKSANLHGSLQFLMTCGLVLLENFEGTIKKRRRLMPPPQKKSTQTPPTSPSLILKTRIQCPLCPLSLRPSSWKNPPVQGFLSGASRKLPGEPDRLHGFGMSIIDQVALSGTSGVPRGSKRSEKKCQTIPTKIHRSIDIIQLRLLWNQCNFYKGLGFLYSSLICLDFCSYKLLKTHHSRTKLEEFKA